MADLTISINAVNDRTMSQYIMTKNGRLTFYNAHATDQLVVTPKDGEPTPFCKSNKKTEIPVITVPKKDAKTVHICDHFAGDQFLYKAKIGTAAVDDPIVIIEYSASIEPIVIIEVAAFVIVGIVGALIGYKIASRKMRGATS